MSFLIWYHQVQLRDICYSSSCTSADFLLSIQNVLLKLSIQISFILFNLILIKDAIIFLHI